MRSAAAARATVAALGLLSWLTIGPGAAAQGETADVLRQGRELYERLELERAVPLLRRVVSSDWQPAATDSQRAEAYRYLGAALALAGKRDSATLAFRAALERDPFAGLDGTRFTPDQVALFALARRQTFAVALRPGLARRIDPRTEHVVFTVVTTHAADLRGIVRPIADTVAAVTIFDGVNEGVRDLRWSGLSAAGRLAPPGRHEVLVIGRSQLSSAADSARIYLDIAHDVEPLEDTLPSLAEQEFLPERYPAGAASADLLKVLGVGAAAVLVSSLVVDDRLGRGDEARWLAAASVPVGVAAFLYRRRHRDLPGNAAVNSARRAAWAAANEQIRLRNAERQSRTILLVTPAAGIGTPR